MPLKALKALWFYLLHFTYFYYTWYGNMCLMTIQSFNFKPWKIVIVGKGHFLALFNFKLLISVSATKWNSFILH